MMMSNAFRLTVALPNVVMAIVLAPYSWYKMDQARGKFVMRGEFGLEWERENLKQLLLRLGLLTGCFSRSFFSY
jgi:hypothetical protein